MKSKEAIIETINGLQRDIETANQELSRIHVVPINLNANVKLLTRQQYLYELIKKCQTSIEVLNWVLY